MLPLLHPAFTYVIRPPSVFSVLLHWSIGPFMCSTTLFLCIGFTVGYFWKVTSVPALHCGCFLPIPLSRINSSDTFQRHEEHFCFLLESHLRMWGLFRKSATKSIAKELITSTRKQNYPGFCDMSRCTSQKT